MSSYLIIIRYQDFPSGINLSKIAKNCMEITKSRFWGQNHGVHEENKTIFWVVEIRSSQSLPNRGNPSCGCFGKNLKAIGPKINSRFSEFTSTSWSTKITCYYYLLIFRGTYGTRISLKSQGDQRLAECLESHEDAVKHESSKRKRPCGENEFW